MQVIPAIDFRDGKVVNLKQGQLNRITTYSDDPVGMADHWVSLGAERLHLVDLDGAFKGRPVNQNAVATIARNHPSLTIQLGGGIRNEATIETYLNAGVDYLIIGTRAVDEPEFVTTVCREFPGHIIVGLDGLDGMVARNGWEEVTDTTVRSLALAFAADGIEAIVYTDISKDGMMGGINLEATLDLVNSVGVPIIASGGVTDLQDIRDLLTAEQIQEKKGKIPGGIMGVITGRALYEGTLNLKEAIDLCRNRQI